MTVSTELSHEEYVGNGVTTDFDFRFRIFESRHLIVVVADDDGNETTLKNGTDYFIVGVGSYFGGKVVLSKPLAKDWKILLERDLPVVQETDLRNQGKFFAEVHEDAFDYLTMLIQKALGTFSLSLRKPTYLSNYYDAKGNRIANLAPPKFGTDSANKDYVDNSIKDIDSKTLRVNDKPINALPNTEQRANKILAFDDNGQPITVLPESGSASDVLIELGKPTGASLIGLPQGQSLADDLSNRIYPGGDAAKKARDIIESGRTPIFMNGDHFFKSIITTGGLTAFVALDDYKGFLTESKKVRLYPLMNANTFFTTINKVATDITLSACAIFGTTKENPELQLVDKGFSNHIDMDSRVPRLILDRTNFVGFKESLDTFTWSSSLYNTDAGWNKVGYHFRNTENTSLRLIGTGATSCGTCYYIERAVYGVMLNAFSDDCDIGIQIDNAQGFSIISPGFEHCKQLARIGTDDWKVQTEGIKWSGGYVYRRNRSAYEDKFEYWGDWGVELFRVYRSEFDFSGIGKDWFKRNKKGFIKLKDCFDIKINGLPPEYIYVDYSGSGTYDDISLGDSCSYIGKNLYISNLGYDYNDGSTDATPFKTFEKLNFSLNNEIRYERVINVMSSIETAFILKNKITRINPKTSQRNTSLIFNFNGFGSNGAFINNVNTGGNGVAINDWLINNNSFIESSSLINIKNLTIKNNCTLNIIGSMVTISNIIMGDNSKIVATSGSQVSLTGNLNGGEIVSNSSIIYTSVGSTNTKMVKVIGGQIFSS